MGFAIAAAAQPPIRLSVYATAGDARRYLSTPDSLDRAARALQRFGIQRVFVEGRRGDEYVHPDKLREIRDALQARGFEVSGGIATVPGKTFGVRQNTALGWLHYEADKTRRDLAQFFTENAPVFDQLIVDDFYCTADTSPVSEKSRGARSWSQYRQDLLVSLIEPLIARPTRAANPRTRLILKFPQWYDRFHLFGYDPARMPAAFDSVWVGTEVRNPETRRMGFVQPTEGYINYRWLQSAIGEKVEGAWFDHIESTAQNFVDQAFQSVLAGAHELTLFHLGDLVEGHPGHAPFLAAFPELGALSRKVRAARPRGIAFYKPPGSQLPRAYRVVEIQPGIDWSAMRALHVWIVRNTHDLSPSGIASEAEQRLCHPVRSVDGWVAYPGWQRRLIQGLPAYFYRTSHCANP